MRLVRSTILLGAAMASVAVAQVTPRAMLVQAAFSTPAKAQALALINKALAALDAGGQDFDTQLQRGIGYGYRGQLTRSPGDAKNARVILGGLAERYPTNPEAQVAYGGWHCSVVGAVGSFIGGTVLGAKKATGFAALDRAVQLGGTRAFFPAYDGLMRIRLDDGDKLALPLLDRAAHGTTPAEVDRITRTAAIAVAAKLRAGDAKGASKLAEQSLPFGRVP